jgi:hypothetical protein
MPGNITEPHCSGGIYGNLGDLALQAAGISNETVKYNLSRRELDSGVTALVRPRKNCKGKLLTRPLVREDAPQQKKPQLSNWKQKSGH